MTGTHRTGEPEGDNNMSAGRSVDHAAARQPEPDGETLVSLFGTTARDSASRIAVSDDERALTYAELAARSDELAVRLAEMGVVRSDRVALYLRRGVDVFVGLLGILKAGAAYVAIDTRLPDARCDLMIANSGARMVITEPGGAPQLRRDDVDVLEWRSQAGPPRSVPQHSEIVEADLACVMFTSGSSGVPKAIMVEHRNLVALARNKALPAVEPDDLFGQVASLSFDTFHIETWCSFAVGARVVVLPTMPELIASDVNRELRRRRVTILLAPTMAVNHVVHEDREAFSSLRLLQTGGDVLQPSACRALWSGRFRGEFFNLYGPTETTTASTCHRIEIGDGEALSVPIGQELDGESVQLLDADQQPVALGEVAELYIGGRGVTRGYLNAPALTAERFRPDPSGSPGSRMYATSDTARRRADRVVEFCGRVDEQVKVRGYRVEPREAERVIGRDPAVRDVAVIVGGEGHDKRLIALVVPHGHLDPKKLRESVATTLPDYLVPSVFIPVAEIPGTVHGKRDVEQLHSLAAEQLRRQSERVEPSDEVERYLVALWEQLLAVEWIGCNDDFFALGGNSMLAFRARRRIERELGVEVEVPEILDAGRLRDLAELIRTRRLGVTAP
jgi:amino acid adenylation domain-containing protein